MFAGVGVLLLGAIVLALVCVAMAVSPVLVVLLLPLALLWLLFRSPRKQRTACIPT